MEYVVEFTSLNTGDQIHSKDYGPDLAKARNRARYVSKSDDVILAYVVACDPKDGRVGAEAYALGRRDHVEGRIV